MKAKGNSFTKTAVWGLMGLLILGLGGFGAVNLNGSARTVGEVGDKSISVDNYARELQQQIRAIESQSGEQLSFQEAQAIGLDRAVLQRLVRLRALDNEADEMGLSIGDTNLRERVVEIPSFQGVDGNFDREGYRFALQQAGLNENEFEQSLREEAGRTLLQQAITGGVSMPEAYANTLVSYVGEQRSFTWAKLTQDDLDAPLPDATDAQLRAFYDDNADRFMLPASKTITYITMGPQDLLDEVELTDEELQAAYDDRADEYIQPERRLIERLVFRDQEATDQAAAALEVDGTTFEALVADRGLSLSDVDLGDLSQQQLDAVFNAEVGDIVGPLPSNLGPALFRVNGVLPSLNTTFEEARPTLVQDLAADRAARLVEVRARDLDDQLAGGATLEQIAEDSKMTLSTIEWTQDSSESIAAYAGFREAATRLTENDFPQIEQLDDGSVFAMRLDGTKEERPNPFDAARADVAAAWRNEQLIDALRAKAETLQAELADGGDFAELGLEPKTGSDQSRDAVVSAAPQGFIAAVFDAAPGDVKLLEGTDEVALVRLDRIKDAAEDDRMTQVKTQIAAQLDDQLSQALFAAFSDDVIRRTAPRVDQQAIDAVHVNFP